MNIKSFIIIALAAFWSFSLAAQPYSVVIKGGHVIDPANQLNGVMDIAIQGRKIVKIAKNIDTKVAGRIIQAKGLYVTPGLLDIHTHHFNGTKSGNEYANGTLSLPADAFSFRNGVTTVVDAGSSGWRNFPLFKSQTIDQSKTRVLAFLNIVGEGMRTAYEQELKDMDPAASARMAKQYSEFIVGIKLAHYIGHNWTPTDRAVEAAKLAGGLPVMVDFGMSRPALSLEELFLKHLRSGDIFTHCFGQLDGRESIMNLTTKKIKPFVWEARKKGILFDVGHGSISFAFSQAIPAAKDGFFPDVISTDLHAGSVNYAMKDLLTTMAKFMAIGMDLKSVIKATTVNAAKAIRRKELGNLSKGSEADIAIFSIRKGDFGLFDHVGYPVKIDKKLECELTLRAGRVFYDLNGIGGRTRW